jgi:tellurite resistance protein TerC
MIAAKAVTNVSEHVGAPLWAWGAIIAFVVAMLVVDLLVVNKDAHVISAKEAGLWSAIWVVISLVFGVILYFVYNGEVATKYFAGYLLEKSLSVDNLFVFALLFSYFKVPSFLQHKVLFWGIFGTLILRGGFIFAGAALVERFDFTLYFFGVFLILSGAKMAFASDSHPDPADNKIFKLIKKTVPMSDEYDGENFFTKIKSKKVATPLFAVMLIIMITDVVFAIDSIPAIFGITTDPFLVMTSNAFAVMGLRSLYFLLADMLHRFHYLQLGLAILLTYIGVKLIINTMHQHFEFVNFHFNEYVSLSVIVVVLSMSVIASLKIESPPTKSDTK